MFICSELERNKNKERFGGTGFYRIFIDVLLFIEYVTCSLARDSYR